MLSQVLLALAHIHGLSIVHGDVKPSNIFVDSQGRARLGDFDLAEDVASRTSRIVA